MIANTFIDNFVKEANRRNDAWRNNGWSRLCVAWRTSHYLH
jgi:hypothetical protein